MKKTTTHPRAEVFRGLSKAALMDIAADAMDLYGDGGPDWGASEVQEFIGPRLGIRRDPIAPVLAKVQS